MTYEEMCKYIVAKEGFTWDEFTAAASNRKRELRTARQICFYFGYVFFKSMSYREIADIFKQDHSTAMHAVSVVQRDMKVEGTFKRKIEEYHKRLSATIYNGWPKDRDKADEILDKANEAIERMRIIAEAYCELTGKRMIEA